MACIYELESFVNKFKTMSYNGFQASLNLSTASGRNCVRFDAELGQLPGPANDAMQPQKRRNRSFYRRQQKRSKKACKRTKPKTEVSCEQLEEVLDSEVSCDQVEKVSGSEAFRIEDYSNSTNSEYSERDTAESQSVIPIQSKLILDTSTELTTTPFHNELEFGDDVAVILKSFSKNPNDDDTPKISTIGNSDEFVHEAVEDLPEKLEEKDILDRPLNELTREEFSAMMEHFMSSLSFDLQPP